MVPLITTIGTVRKYLKVSFVNANAMLPDFEGVQKKYIVPILGKDLYNTIESEATTNPSEPSDLLKLVLRAVAPLGYFSDLAMVSTQITDMGVGTVSSEHFVNAQRWQFLQLKENLEDKGCAALEELITWLYEDSATEDITWTVSDGFNTIIKTGKEFNQYFTIYQPYRTFESLRPIVKKIEDEEVRPLIGDTFFEYLRDNTEPSADEKTIIQLIKKAIAYLTIKSASELLPVRISADGFTVLLTHNPDANNQGHQQAPAVQMSVLATRCEESGRGYLQTLIDTLNTKASTELFPTFFASSYYTAPKVAGNNDCKDGSGRYMETDYDRELRLREEHNSRYNTFVL